MFDRDIFVLHVSSCLFCRREDTVGFGCDIYLAGLSAAAGHCGHTRNNRVKSGKC